MARDTEGKKQRQDREKRERVENTHASIRTGYGEWFKSDGKSTARYPSGVDGERHRHVETMEPWR